LYGILYSQEGVVMKQIRSLSTPGSLIAVSLLYLCVPARIYAQCAINFDTFPNGAAVPNGTIITTQYATSCGVTFSSTGGGPQAIIGSGAASSLPNFLIGNPNSFFPIVMDFANPFTGKIRVTLIGVGETVVTATALATDLVTVVDSVSVTNPGTGDGVNNNNPVVLFGAGIARVQVAITTPFDEDDFGIDDVALIAVSAAPTLGTVGLMLTLTVLLVVGAYKASSRIPI
jgi:hypothetical protein